jgi:predicted RecB family nuclease
MSKDTTSLITAAVFSAFLKCPTKAHLSVIDEPRPGGFFEDIDTRISSLYKVTAKHRLIILGDVAELLDFRRLQRSISYETITHYVDCETAIYNFAPPPRRSLSRQPPKSPFGTVAPVLFCPWDKPDLSHILLLCFGALSLLQVTGTLPDAGILIHGNGYHRRTVRVGNYVARTRKIIDAIGVSWRATEPPPLVLNRHCVICDFRTRCRGLTIERDDLSLLDAMTGKERVKCNAKGISTITQLSHGYHPRRRKRNRSDTAGSADSAKRPGSVDRNDHKLRALAIKKNQIHVVGVTASVPRVIEFGSKYALYASYGDAFEIRQHNALMA